MFAQRGLVFQDDSPSGTEYVNNMPDQPGFGISAVKRLPGELHASCGTEPWLES